MAAAHVIEIERKFDAKDSALLPPLRDLPGVDRVEGPVEHRLEAEYFDTKDLRLASARITLRRRTGGEDAGWHLKLPSGPDERKEFHEPLGEASDGVPEPLLKLVSVHTRKRALGPVARVKTRRIVHRLLNKKGAVLADVSDDQVQAEALKPERTVRHWREWEIELVKGSRKLLDAGQDLLAAAGVRPSAHHSKLARALGRDPQEAADAAPQPKPKSPAADVVLAYLWEQVRELKAQDPLVRLDAPDAVHKMRVATRRMRSLLATYRKLLKDAEAVNSLRDELKWLAGVLGEARDAEVMHARLKDMVAEEPGELVMGPVIRRIDLELGADYQKAHTKVLDALDGRRYFRLLDAFESLLATPPLAPRASKPARKVIPRLESSGTSNACAPQFGKPPGIPPAPVTIRPCMRRGKTVNACGTPPKPQHPSTSRTPAAWPMPPTVCRRFWLTTRTASSPATCCAGSARRPSSRAKTDSAMAGCTRWNNPSLWNRKPAFTASGRNSLPDH